MKKIAVLLTLAVAFCFVMPSLAQAGMKAWMKNSLHNSQKAAAIPVWKITQDGTILSVPWVDATNPRFAVYDTDGDNTTDPSTWVDDVVLDKETGLVWERCPSETKKAWYGANYDAYYRYLGGRKGWRLPTIEELSSLVDPNNTPSLPNGHPFTVQPSFYWSSTTHALDTTQMLGMGFGDGNMGQSLMSVDRYFWCVRGGQGYDAY